MIWNSYEQYKLWREKVKIHYELELMSMILILKASHIFLVHFFLMGRAWGPNANS